MNIENNYIPLIKVKGDSVGAEVLDLCVDVQDVHYLKFFLKYNISNLFELNHMYLLS